MKEHRLADLRAPSITQIFFFVCRLFDPSMKVIFIQLKLLKLYLFRGLNISLFSSYRKTVNTSLKVTVPW